MTEHKNWVKDIFDRASSGYGEKGCSFFDYFGERLVAIAKPAKGAQILDVATGKGAVLFPAARSVGPHGSAVGIDLSSRMIHEAAKKVPYPWTQLHQMDAEDLLFPNQSFDIVFCAFALFFFPHLAQALSECKRVLKSYGSLAVSTFSQQASLDLWIAERVKEYGITAKLSTNLLDRLPALQKHLSAAGFTDIEIKEESKVFWHESAEAWWDSLWTHGIRSKLEKLTPNQLEELKKDALRQAGKDRISEERHVLYVIARNGLSSCRHSEIIQSPLLS